MVEAEITIGLVVEQVPPEGAWADVAGARTIWRPVTVFETAPDVAPWTALGSHQGRARFYAGAFPILLYSTDTANYLGNLGTGAPKLWVVLREATGSDPVDVVSVTADPAEGEAHTEAGADMVASVAMPPGVAAEIAAFIAAHHVERPFVKRKRDRRPE